MTERLYYQDPYLRSFTANVVDHCDVDGQPAIVLDATAFYPTAGGQPHDTGTLDGVRVVDVQVDERGRLLHVLDGPLSGTGASGATAVRGEIDWQRRFDHMQQHTGQHILSRAFVEVCQAETVSFHLGEGLSTIDLDRAPLSPDVVKRAQESANAVVLDSREVIARFVDQGELAALPARKLRARKVPVVQGPIRVVEVSGYDWSPCGGTHVRNTGQIGPIQVVRLERRNEQTRITFACGWRALSDYAHKDEIVQELAAHFTTSESEILASVERLEAEIRASRKALAATQMELLDYETAQWLSQAEKIGAMHVVRLVFDQREVSLLKEAARRMTENPGTVVLLAARQPHPQFVFARSEDLAIDIGAVMRIASAIAGGRGGGRPQFAQGGAPEGAAVDRVLDEAVRQVGIL